MYVAKLRLALAVTTGIGSAWFIASPAAAQIASTTLPSGPSVGAQTGTDTISFTQPPSTNTMNVAIGNNQQSIINWSSFSIGSDATVQFSYNGSAPGTVLNRVIGGDPSYIYGQLLGPSDLSIFLFNSNGILFGANSVVDVGSLVVSSLGITDADFMDGSPYTFVGTGTTGISAASGASITTSDGPLVLIGGFVDTSGSLAATGDVVIAAASDVSIALADGSPISMTINQGTPVSSGVVVGGTVSGSNVYLAVASRSGVMDALLNVSGTVTATSATVTDRGIVLSAGTSASGITVAGGGGSDTSGGTGVSLGGSLDSATDVEIQSAGSISGIGTIDAADQVNASADGLSLGAVTAGTDITLFGGAGGIGNGAQDLNLTAGGNITLNDPSEGRDIALSAGGSVTTGSLTARDDIVIRADGSVNTGAVTSGATVDSLAAVNVDGAGDMLAGFSHFGHDVRFTGNGILTGVVRANGSGSDIVLDGGATGIGSGSVDLDMMAGGHISLAGTTKGRDVAIVAGGSVGINSLVARDDIVIQAAADLRAESVISGAVVDGFGPTDSTGAADTLAGATLAGNDVNLNANGVLVDSIQARGVASDVILSGGAMGVGIGWLDLDVAAGGNIVINGAASGIDIALSAGGTVTTGSLAARDDVVVKATGAITTGAVTSGATLTDGGPVEVAGAADALIGRTVTGHTVRMFGSGILVGPVRANGSGSNIVLNGGAAGIGDGSTDLDLNADGRIVLGSSARGRDISLVAGGNVLTKSLTARDDVVVRSPGLIRVGAVTSGATVDSLGAVDVAGAADSAAAATLAGNDVNMVGNRITAGAIRANGTGSDISLNASRAIGYRNFDLDLQAGGSIILSGLAWGRDVAIVAGGDVVIGDVRARDDIYINGSQVTHGSLEAGVLPVDVSGAADAAAGTTLEGNQVIVNETL